MDETSETFDIHSVTPERWEDLEELFGPRGATGGCWCMYWRLKRSEYELLKGEGNHQLMKSIVDSGEVPGLLAYVDGKPAGWCSIAPRENFTTLARSRILKPVDDQPVWSVVCFFIAKTYRRQGLSVRLLETAVRFARDHGAKIVEGYPSDTAEGGSPDVFVYTGLASAFEHAGFREVLRRSPTRPIMRYTIEEE